MMDYHKWICFFGFITVCFVSNSVQVEPTFKTEPSDAIGTDAATVILKCVVNNPPPGDLVQWTKDGFGLGTDRELSAFPRYKFVGNRDIGEYDLMISNVQLMDDGVYECQVMATATTKLLRSRPASLIINVPPDKPEIEGGEHLEMVADVPVNITCQARNGRPNAQIEWYQDETKITEDTYYSFEDFDTSKKTQDATGMLTITPKKSDQGKRYECHASNNATLYPLWTKTELVVLYPPEVSMTIDPSSRIREFDSVYFTCEAVANPSDITWKWYKDDEEIDGATSNVLGLAEVERDYHGKTISCEATNKVGNSKQSFEMKLEYGPKFDTPAHTGVDPGETATLTCKVDSNPEAGIVWRRKDSPRILGSSGTLTIADVTEDDFGIYQCTASVSGFEHNVQDVYLLKKGPPVILSSDQQYAKYGATASLVCSARSVPQASSISWKKDGTDLDLASLPRYEVKEEDLPTGRKSYLIIKKVQSTDFGDYNCSIENSYGRDDIKIKFTQKDAVPVAYILGGVLAGVFIIIVIIIALFLYHRSKNTSDSDSESSTNHMTERKDSPDLKESRANIGPYLRESPDGYSPYTLENGYRRPASTIPYGTYPGKNENRYEPSPGYGTPVPHPQSEYGTYGRNKPSSPGSGRGGIPPTILPPPREYANNSYPRPPSRQSSVYGPPPADIHNSKLATNV